ncbi:MAG: hypothetical protein GOMPHAMPRED_003537 [Gomphillus americanus]|uniref:HMG box domain-containing protein n=1 Tax=Gomphillus americanus TaxID=1940652 RepID=A0A8H3FGB9_9LECA|nr:MAG: hypothetical protein GOMPHAMPRED_003537 [Gomphillus americanus]
MLLARIGQSATGRYASAISLLQRVKFIGRVVADSKSTATLSIRSRPIGLSNRISHQEFATKAPASKPKAHTSRTTTRKTSSTKKAAPKKRKTARKVAKKTVKRARKPRVKKELSDEEKQKLKIRELKLNALGTPHGLPATAWAVLVAEITKNSTTVVVGVKEAAVKYRNLLPEERERYNHIANENKTKNQAAYKSWVESYTPDQIRVANNARVQLRRLTTRGRRWTQIRDDRQVKRPASARILFSKDRWASGDFNGMKVTDVPPLLSREWNALSTQEKKVYEDRYTQSRAEYTAERSRVYGSTNKPTQRARASKDSTAATAQVRREAAAAAAT